MSDGQRLIGSKPAKQVFSIYCLQDRPLTADKLIAAVTLDLSALNAVQPFARSVMQRLMWFRGGI